MTYVVSDIHGDYEKYARLLQMIQFSRDDTLFVLGDVVDRGSQSMKVLQDMMLRPNVIPLIGNHEYMALQCLQFLLTEVSQDSIASLDVELLQGLAEWQAVGGQAAIEEFRRLSAEERADIVDYFGEFSLFEELTVGGKRYVLVHAGPENFSPDRPMADYALHELIFHAPDYSKTYFADKYLVTGHNPTRNIPGNPRPDRIFRENNHIAIDCGCGYGGTLGALCLDTGEEFYVDE